MPAIGVLGYLAGPDVYIFDTYSLANPIGSHTVVVDARPAGHEKYIGPAWMVARFGSLTGGRTRSSGGPSIRGQVAAAWHGRSACDPLAAYLQAITAPLSRLAVRRRHR